jgi:hypothetical protein
MAEIELCLDIAVFEDGLCVGPDDSGLVESVTNDLQRQRDTAREIVEALSSGASEGHIFEVLRPLARRASSTSIGITQHCKIRSRLLTMFANTAINRLINAPGSELQAWFEHIAESLPIRLYRPS